MTGSRTLLRSRVRVASFNTNDSHPPNLGLTWILSVWRIWYMDLRLERQPPIIDQGLAAPLAVLA